MKSNQAVAPPIAVVFVILICVAFFGFIFGTIGHQITNQDNSYCPNCLNTPEFGYMSATIVGVPLLALVVGLIYVVVKGQQRDAQ